jgi:hypothetical protein
MVEIDVTGIEQYAGAASAAMVFVALCSPIIANEFAAALS